MPQGIKDKPAPRLSDEGYFDARATLVVTCVDVVVRNGRGEVLLCERAHHPQKDWWLVGGRMYKGDELAESAARNVEREIGLTINPKRFTYLTSANLAWLEDGDKSVRNGVNPGVHTFSLIMMVTISDDEAAAICLNDEYVEGGSQWLSLQDILLGPYHSALHHVANTLLLS